MSIKLITIKKVFKSTENKDGVPYVYKKGKNEGKPFVRVSIASDDMGEGMYSTCVLPGERATKLEEGQQVLLKFEEKDGFKNFGFPTKGEQQVYEDLTNTK